VIANPSNASLERSTILSNPLTVVDEPVQPVYGPDGAYGPVTPNQRLQILAYEAEHMFSCHAPIPQGLPGDDDMLNELDEMQTPM